MASILSTLDPPKEPEKPAITKDRAWPASGIVCTPWKRSLSGLKRALSLAERVTIQARTLRGC